MRRIRLISTSWSEGRVFDLWMIVHFLSGLAGGFSNVFFGLSTRGVYTLGVSMLLVWEVIEYIRQVRESWENRVLDVVVGVAGISLALWCAPRLSRTAEFSAFGLSTVAVVAGAAFGWMAFRARERSRSADGARADDGHATTRAPPTTP